MSDLVEICLFTFIPLDIVTDPVGVDYKADGPGFSYTRSEFRTRHLLRIDPSKVTPSNNLGGRQGIGATVVPQGFLVDDDPRVGMSIAYLPMIKILQTLPPSVLHYRMEIDRDTADRLTSMHWYFRRFADGSFRLTMEANATNPVAVTRYMGIVPAINYWLTFEFAANRSVTVSGTHDGFPAYDFYFQGQQFHRYDPIALGASPLSLFGPACDIAIDGQRVR